MDRIDRKIIDILQTNARAPLKEIADRVFLSSPAVSARIAKLEKDGVLTGYQLPRSSWGCWSRRSSTWIWTPSSSRSFTPTSKAAAMLWSATA